ncbi:hypothetical protein P4S93_13900 [Aneurinibacillus thermoaerophilus]|uniref:hypothetical protein n=1 Tax=Aneurinibacillus thermoaerophilus TaxID=143495 RepID=UPI002E20A8FD|nr:hypothetical protein [Aneurinibacillus thermoaerophilus]MED0761853.1 hypothetical protein [Aneurinibacillus thermoaerophilus]
MTNAERLLMEITGINLTPAEIDVYLSENCLSSTDTYDANNKQNTIAIYEAALSVLESIANNPEYMKTRKFDDMTIDKFAENLQNRIDQLERKIRKMKSDLQTASQSNFFMLFRE